MYLTLKLPTTLISLKYDTQKDIYYTIFEELKDAVSKLDESAANNVGSYDLIYGGDATKWKKFANSIRLRMAVRISDVDAAKAKTEAAACHFSRCISAVTLMPPS